MALRPTSSIHPVTGEFIGADGNRLGAFSQGWHRLWWGFFEKPELGLVDMPRGDGRHAENGSGISGLVAEQGQGQVVNMARYRMEQAARTEVEKAHSLGLEPVDPENLV